MSRIDNRDNPVLRDQRKIDLSRSTQRTDTAKPVKNPFETVLSETKSRLSPDPQSPESNLEGAKRGATEQAVRETTREHEGKDQEKKFKERERQVEEKKSDHSGDTKGVKAKIAEKKVIARSALTGRSQKDTTGGGRESMTQGDKKGKSFGEVMSRSLLKKSATTKGETVAASSPFKTKMAEGLTAKAPSAATVLSKAVMDQIVQYVRIMIKPGGQKEMEVALHQKIFRGLKVRVSSTGGKVKATLVTSSSEDRKVFESNRQALHQSLAEKGIEVETIDVIMTSTS
ncbi:MAG: flagellar hook-length control protein FliK [Deltaproteobacteria bacterium]|nr:flagellar hook-length control protein FliK [Deltaproteobacteria bacterium]